MKFVLEVTLRYIVEYVVTECMCDLMCKDKNGATLLHSACNIGGKFTNHNLATSLMNKSVTLEVK